MNLPVKTTEFDQKVEFLAREMCKELGYPEANWRAYDELIRQWLEQEAFSKVRSKYWNDEKYQEAKAKK
jgi:hypothetical protein